ncbi:MAG: glycine cleavage system aminomethyltransferase GcvT [Thermoleophilaceae bacterium]
MSSAADTLRRTSLFDRHAAAGARLVSFAGWEMPVQYEGVRTEHLAVRQGAGVFDVSHMGEIETTGPDAEAFLQHLLSNDVGKLAEGGAQYSVLCRDDGGVIDDLFTYRLRPGEDDQPLFLTVTNASNHEADHAWFSEHAEGFDVTVTDVADRYAMLAVQGPEAREVVARLTRGELPERMRTATVGVAGSQVLACGTGYTGEDGVELLMAPSAAPAIWDALIDDGVVPAGLAARDTLRTEVCFHLYGNDLTLDHNPLEAGLGWAVKLDTGFVGSDALRTADTGRKLVCFAFTGAGIPRQGNVIFTDAGEGVVTSGTMSPTLGYGIGMGYVPEESVEPGTKIEVDVRGRARAAEVRAKPLYSKSKE